MRSRPDGGAAPPAPAEARPQTKALNSPKRGAGRVALEELERSAGSSRHLDLPRLGYDLARWLLVLLAVYLVAVVVYGCVSYPRIAELRSVVDPAKVGELHREILSEWRQNVRGLLDPVVPPILALLSTVVGYIFGRQKS